SSATGSLWSRAGGRDRERTEVDSVNPAGLSRGRKGFAYGGRRRRRHGDRHERKRRAHESHFGSHVAAASRAQCGPQMEIRAVDARWSATFGRTDGDGEVPPVNRFIRFEIPAG